MVLLNQTYYMILVNDLIRDYSLTQAMANTIAKSLKTEKNSVQVLEVKSVKIYEI